MNGEIKKILITVKAYPNLSPKYGETVCVAGIDLQSGKWIRLYPITFRDLDEDKKFSKYNIIEARVNKARDDRRPESYKIDISSIKIISRIDTKDKWLKRKELILPLYSGSLCEIIEQEKITRRSLGLFKPDNVSFDWVKTKTRDSKERSSVYAQLGFFDKKKGELEKIPYSFRYHFKCKNEPSCTGHKLLIIDWELGQAYRSWRWTYKNEELLLQKIKEKWLNTFCSQEKDLYFFVGNMKRFRSNFMVLGVFYPPKTMVPR